MVSTIDRLIRESHTRQLRNNEIAYVNSFLRNRRLDARRFWSSRMHNQWLPGRRGMRTMYPVSQATARRRRLRRR